MDEKSNLCKKCGKEIESGKYCKMCKIERKEKRLKVMKQGGGAVASVGLLALGLLAKHNSDDNS